MKNKKVAARTSKVKAAPLVERISTFLTMDRLFIGGSLIVAALIVGIWGLNSLANRPIDIQGVERVAALGGHTENPVDYSRIPPAGGLHYPLWQNCGIYEQPIADEYAVHSLEHGAVWIMYRPDLPSEELDVLRTVAQQGSTRLLSPYPNLPTAIVVTSWGYQLQLEQATDPRLTQFARQYERNPQYAPEPNGLCMNGESRTLSQLASSQ